MSGDDFEDIVTGFTSSSVWLGAIREAGAELHRERPSGLDVTLIGHRAWKQLTPVQQAEALPDLFAAYVVLLHERERAEHFDRLEATGETCLDGDDEYLLHEALGRVQPITEDTEVNRVCASALSNVLDEVALLRHRLGKRTAQDGS